MHIIYMNNVWLEFFGGASNLRFASKEYTNVAASFTFLNAEILPT